MIDVSRTHLYDFLYELFYGYVTKNVYAAREPQQLTESDVKDGFIVIYLGEINDESEFRGEAYGEVRCYVEAYVPAVSRGRLDYEKYSLFEDSINEVIEMQLERIDDSKYHIKESSALSSDTDSAMLADVVFFTFIKSFIVYIES